MVSSDLRKESLFLAAAAPKSLAKTILHLYILALITIAKVVDRRLGEQVHTYAYYGENFGRNCVRIPTAKLPDSRRACVFFLVSFPPR